MAEEILVVLNKKDPTCGLGFSLLGTPGLPPIIYDVVENSPAAECGKVEAGDVILKVNDTNVKKLNTKEVLKCLRLSGNQVTLILKRDPVVKTKVCQYLSTPLELRTSLSLEGWEGSWSSDSSRGESPDLPHSMEHCRSSPIPTSALESEPPPQPPKFEAFVMTGDRVLKLCRNPQSSILPQQQRKVDSLRNNINVHNSQPRHNSVPTSPVENDRHKPVVTTSSSLPPPTSSYAVRTSKSEDHLQFNKDSLSTVSIDIDDDVTSSLNTLLCTKQESEVEDQRIVWTYNAPLSYNSDSSSPDSPPGSPASPTSVSSSVMSSNSSGSGEKRTTKCVPVPDLSQSEAVSNISSPDFQEEDSEIIGRDVMEVSDPSDSDSTLLVSETQRVRRNTLNGNDNQHRIIIQVKGPEKQGEARSRSNSPRSNRLSQCSIKEEDEQALNNDVQPTYQSMYEDDESLVQLSEGAANLARSVSPPDEDSDSLHSYHCSPKAVDKPSAVRLAKRLYMLDGFKKSDVSRHLSKNNEFSRVVAEEYLNYFNFTGESLDLSLHKFLKHFCLTGETQERERVLVHFSKRYLECNPNVFSSQEAVHTLTCAIMLLNTDLHGQIMGRKMACSEFIENLAQLNDGENFPREVLKALYQSIKSHPLEWAQDDDLEDGLMKTEGGSVVSTPKGIYDVPSTAPSIEYKKGYVMRKCCIGPNAKKTPLGKRGWKMFYCTLRDLVLYLHKDERGFDKQQVSDSIHNAIRIHHALATKASDYTKHLHVFRLETADQAVYLFQTSDSKELQSWMDTINYVCAAFSAQALPGAVGSQKKFQRPLLPSSHTKLNSREQLREHEITVQKLEAELDLHRRHPPERGSKGVVISTYKEKDAYLQYELKRYKTYASVLRSRMSQLSEVLESSLIESIGESAEEAEDKRSGSPNTRYRQTHVG